MIMMHGLYISAAAAAAVASGTIGFAAGGLLARKKALINDPFPSSTLGGLGPTLEPLRKDLIRCEAATQSAYDTAVRPPFEYGISIGILDQIRGCISEFENALAFSGYDPKKHAEKFCEHFRSRLFSTAQSTFSTQKRIKGIKESMEAIKRGLAQPALGQAILDNFESEKRYLDALIDAYNKLLLNLRLEERKRDNSTQPITPPDWRIP